jgi:hypothetical protein
VLAKAPVGIQFNEHVEFDGVTVFEAACKMGLLGGSSRSGATSLIGAASLKGWIKVRNSASPAMLRVGGAL